MIDYDTFPLKKFFKILKDESLLKGYGINNEDWESLKDEWNERHPVKGTGSLVEAHKKVMAEVLAMNKAILLLVGSLTSEEEARGMFEMAKIRFIEDPVDRISYLQTEIEKRKTKVEIFDARRKKLEKEIERSKVSQENQESTISDINEVLASLEISGINIGSYEEMTIGRYDGLSKGLRNKIRKNERNNNRKRGT